MRIATTVGLVGISEVHSWLYLMFKMEKKIWINSSLLNGQNVVAGLQSYDKCGV